MDKYRNLERACGGTINPDTIRKFRRAMDEYEKFMGDLAGLLGPADADVPHGAVIADEFGGDE